MSGQRRAWIGVVAVGVALVWATPKAQAVERGLVVVIDTSATADSPQHLAARELVAATLFGVPSDDRVAVVTYSDKVVVASTLDQPRVHGADEVLRGRTTMTPSAVLYDALWDAAQILGQLPVAADRAIVLIATGRDRGSALMFEDAERALAVHDVAVLAFAVGAEPDAQQMRRLTKLTRGRWFDGETWRDPETLRAAVAATLALRRLPPGANSGGGGAVSATADGELPSVAVTPAGALGEPAQEPTVAESGWRLGSTLLTALFAVGLGAVVVALGLRSRIRRQATDDDSGSSERDAVAEHPILDPVPRPSQVPELPPTPAPSASGRVAVVTEQLPADRVQPSSAGNVLTRPASGAVADPLAATFNVARAELAADDDAPGEQLDKTYLLQEAFVVVVRRGRDVGQSFLLRPGDTLIGRAQINDITLDDRSVSVRHLRIRVEGKMVTVIDAGSTNGSFLNERRIEREEMLEPGDCLRLGETELVFRVEQRRG